MNKCNKNINKCQILTFCFVVFFGTSHAKTVDEGIITINEDSEANAANAISLETQSNKRTLVYSSGMLTTHQEATENLGLIRKRLENVIDTHKFVLAYNHDEDFLNQFAEVATQHIMQENNSTERSAWMEFAYRFLQPHKYSMLDRIEALLTLFDKDNSESDTDLQEHINKIYLPLLNAGEKVVILAHSQGNFYANRSWNIIKQMQDGDSLSKQIGIVAVASPASYVADGGLHTTNTLDMIIKAVNKTSIKTIPANATHPFTSDDLLGHGITEIYLDDKPEGYSIRTKIERDINTTFNRLVIKDLSCVGFSAEGKGSSLIPGYYKPGENFSGILNYTLQAYNIKNSLNINSKNGTPLVGTGLVSGPYPGSFYYNSNYYNGMQIIIGDNGKYNSSDDWELNITCPKLNNRIPPR